MEKEMSYNILTQNFLGKLSQVNHVCRCLRLMGVRVVKQCITEPSLVLDPTTVKPLMAHLNQLKRLPHLNGVLCQAEIECVKLEWILQPPKSQ